MNNSSSKSHSSAIDIVSFVFLAVFALRFVATLAVNLYDWDIDHHLYFGIRMLSGELIYTKEYYDKLPIAQYLQLVPAALGSMRAWVVLSAGISICAALALRNSLIIMLRQSMTLADSLVKSIAFSGASFYLLLVSSLPGSIIHINPAAAGFVLISLYLLLCFSSIHPSRRRSYCLLFSAVCGAIAISIRPYMAPSVVLLGVWMSSRSLTLRSTSRLDTIISVQHPNPALFFFGSVLRFTILWSALLFLAGVAMNAIPYLLTGSLDALIDGIRHNAYSLNPHSTRSILLQQAKDFWSQGMAIVIASSFAILASSLILCERISGFLRGSLKYRSSITVAYVDIILLGIVSMLLLELAIVSRHYWSHYQQLFSPYLAISFALGLAIVNDRRLFSAKYKVKPMFFLVIFAFFILLVSRAEISAALSSLSRIHDPHPQASILADIDRLVSERAAKGLSTTFLDANHMYSHWQRNESRHGFPHAANFGHIGKGWWEGLDSTNKKLSDFPYNLAELCRKLDSEGPALVFVSSKDSTAYNCLVDKSSSYRPVSSTKLRTPGLAAFERNS